MLVIRSRQLAEFEESSKNEFEERMFVFLNEEWTAQCGALGAERVRGSIKTGTERAESYDLTTENQIAKYINLMYALEFDFDRSTASPWAGAILTDESLDANYKIESLYRLAAEA